MLLLLKNLDNNNNFYLPANTTSVLQPLDQGIITQAIMNLYKAWRTVKEEMDNLIIVNEKDHLAYKVKNNIEFNKKILKTISEKNYHLKF